MFKLLSSMAVSNLKKNHSLYLPYGLATALVTMVLFIIRALSAMPELETLRGGATMSETLGFGTIVVIVVAFLVILYANAFVTKNRSKEYGLYGILGLDRKNIQLLSFIELLVFATASITIGIALGMIFHRLSFAILLKLIQYPLGITYSFHFSSIIFVYLTMTIIFVIIFFLNATKIYMSRPLEMLKEKKKGETKGRFITIRAIIGAVLLGGAYYMAQTIESPVDALVYFFIAVLLVVVATYILFDAASIALLTLLQKSKKLFYQPTNFISISNLKFRMRKNAAGLASVCILSTMVLVTLATTVALQQGTDNTINRMFKREYSAVGLQVNAENKNEFENAAQQMQQVSKGQVSDEMHYIQVLSLGKKNQEGIQLTESDFAQKLQTIVLIMSEQDYNRNFGTNYNLGDREIVLGKLKGNADQPSTVETVSNEVYTVTGTLDTKAYEKKMPGIQEVSENVYVAVVKDAMKFVNDTTFASFYSMWNTSSEASSKKDEFNAYAEVLEEMNVPSMYIQSKAETAESMYSLMGSLLFVGAILSVTFFIGAVLVIYYKQISEGYEDRDRFVILQKLGIDQKTIKKSINRQVLIVFFLPLVTAFIHTAFAFKMYRKIIQLFGVDGNVTLNATMVIGAIFVVVYLIVYQITSRSYYKIIKR